MDRAVRRSNTQKKIDKRLRMAKELGTQGGTLYEKHVAKIKKSGGYMRDGNVDHYVQCGFRVKTKHNGYGPEVRRKHSEQIRYEAMNEDMEEFENVDV